MAKQSVCMFIFFGVISCVAGCTSNDRDKVITINGEKFNIPSHYILDKSLENFFSLMPGLDFGVEQILIGFDAQEIADHIPEYIVMDGNYRNNMTVIITALNKNEYFRYTNSISDTDSFSDPWYGRGLHEGREVKRLGETDFYKIFSSESQVFYQIFRLNPEVEAEIPRRPKDFFVARCVSGKSPLTETKFLTTCGSHVMYGYLALDYRISFMNIMLVDLIDEFLIKKMDAWKIN